ncbi:shikimate kinase [Treponema brennaborense]|uniref:Shikimate kinase n=1 Tax=Treponema brennaborense (strain DSM 12168 / CIP 105900 / DD5/3) TaxID=906968 RepID=F4LLY9_TREBD|nr:shikimate kinase [Treponema brennaborense]AEE15681.1 Shikimate kinase [Treponema brennaborense DSM 12168]
MNKAIVLTGIKHCGKSALGRLLAQELNCPFYDTDAVIRELTGRSAREIYTENGAEAFAFSETAACRFLAETLSAAQYKYAETVSAVIATGGGICGNTGALDILHTFGIFVFLDIGERLAADRIAAEIVFENGTMRNLPAYIACKNPATEQDVRNCFSEFYKERTALYGKIADLTWTPEAVSKDVNAKNLAAALRTAGAVSPPSA